MPDKTIPALVRLVALIAAFLLSSGLLMGCAAAYEDPDARTFGEFTDDVALVSKVKATLISRKSISGLRINVDVYRRQVTLSGKVESPEQEAAAIAAATAVKGVAGVTSNLSLKN